MSEFTTHPLTPDRWDHLVTVFGGGDGKGDCGRCWCMWWRLPRPTAVGSLGKENKALFKQRVDADRTPVFEHGLMWELDHIKRLPSRTPPVVSCRLIDAA